MHRLPGASLVALVALLAGFAFDDTPAGRAFGEAIARAIAAAAAPMLEAAGTGLLRSGTELRAAGGDWAVRVSEVCDGTGLVVSLLALLLALAPSQGGWRWGLPRLVAGFALIQAFNLLRVIGLVLALDHAPAAFAPLHDRVFPYLAVALPGLLLLAPRRLLLLAGLAALASVVLTPVIGAAARPLAWAANLALPLGLPEVGEIALRPAGWSVGTYFLAATDPVQLHLAPLEPAHFLLSLPVLVAAAVLARRGLWLLPAGGLMLLALVVAAPVATWALAEARAPVTLLLPDGSGAFLPTAYSPPETLRAALRLTQNALVHFLLLVLPFLVLAPSQCRPASGPGART